MTYADVFEIGIMVYVAFAGIYIYVSGDKDNEGK
jgi:hypothetical protein